MKKLLNTKLKDMKAITLIALVITIVILIILAGVLINLTLSENGLFTKAKLAKEKYEQAFEDENTKINDIYGQLLVATDGTVTIDLQTLNQLIDARIAASGLASQVQTLQQNSIRFVNFNDVIDNTTLKSKGATYTATRDCAIVGHCQSDTVDRAARLFVNGVGVTSANSYINENTITYDTVGSVTYVKAGDVVTTRDTYGVYDYTVYGLYSATPSN